MKQPFIIFFKLLNITLHWWVQKYFLLAFKNKQTNITDFVFTN